jgi:hypothetical protein
MSYENPQNNVTQTYTAVFYLKAKCFCLDINRHQAKKIKPLKGR